MYMIQMRAQYFKNRRSVTTLINMEVDEGSDSKKDESCAYTFKKRLLIMR